MGMSQTLCRKRMESDTQRDQRLEKLTFQTNYFPMPHPVSSLKSRCSVVILCLLCLLAVDPA